MTVSDLDRLVSRTELTPVSRRGISTVRRAVVSGRCGDAIMGRGHWSVAIDSDGGSRVTMSFSFRKEQ